jgi:DNA-binding CsgD family transcriptional regulator
MRQTDENPAYSTLRRTSSVSPDRHHPSDTRDLSDREAVVAVMIANGLTCEDIALRLSLAQRTVEGHLHQALAILGLSHTKDLTYVIVASHYNRNAPTTRAQPQQSAKSAWLEVDAFSEAGSNLGSDASPSPQSGSTFPYV